MPDSLHRIQSWRERLSGTPKAPRSEMSVGIIGKAFPDLTRTRADETHGTPNRNVVGDDTSAVGKGLVVLANLNIEGGIDITFDVLNAKSGKWGFKLRMLMSVLPKYGANAKPALAKLKDDPRLKNVERGKFGAAWKAMVKQIESSTGTRKMISVEDAKKYGTNKKG